MIRIATTFVLALVLSATAAFAQPAITIDVENPVLLPGESTTVTMVAGFERSSYAMAGLQTDLAISSGSVGWSDAALVPPMSGPGTSPGMPTASGFENIAAGQLHFLGAMIYADPTNPIAFWRATYTAPLDPAVPFEVDLATMTRRYDVYPRFESSASESRLAELVEGAATIHVIPAPASALVFACGLLALRRRR